MAIPTLGKITLTAVSGGGSNVTFTTDPETYGLMWPKRLSIFQVIDDIAIQDFGKRAVDCVVRMDSGSGQWLNKSVVTAMDANEALRGATWQLQDFEDNDFTVSIQSWVPVLVRGMALVGLYVYSLELRVHAMAKLRGINYSGG